MGGQLPSPYIKGPLRPPPSHSSTGQHHNIGTLRCFYVLQNSASFSNNSDFPFALLPDFTRKERMAPEAVSPSSSPPSSPRSSSQLKLLRFSHATMFTCRSVTHLVRPLSQDVLTPFCGRNAGLSLSDASADAAAVLLVTFSEINEKIKDGRFDLRSQKFKIRPESMSLKKVQDPVCLQTQPY